MCLGATRQLAYAFNQPLSFDTSSVTTMEGMFRVRTPPCVPFSVSSRFLRARRVCTATAATRPRASQPLVPSTCFGANRQSAQAFNQPLSFDTSSVTSMSKMFQVRTLPLAMPSVQSVPQCTRCVRRQNAVSRSRTSHPPASPSTCLGVARQYAAAFNKPLSLDTSSVTSMYGMFAVRTPARVLCPVSSRFLRAR